MRGDWGEADESILPFQEVDDAMKMVHWESLETHKNTREVPLDF